VKFHWKPKKGMQSVVWNEALKLNGADPDFHRRDLWDAIQMGDYPEWELGLQLFDEDFANRFDFDVLDATKIVPEEDLPVRRVGRLALDRTVDNSFAETEQVAFCTQNVVPGIDFTDDPLLQGRNFSYLDTQLKRLGSPNFHEIPVNRPRGCPFHNLQQDGHMRMTVPKGRAMYQPNSFGEGPRESPEKGFSSYPGEVSGPKLRIRSESFADHYSQARQFYISQTELEQGHIAAALTFELSKVETPAIRARMVSHLLDIDAELGRKVAAGLRLKERPEPAPGGNADAHGPEGVAGAQHHPERPRVVRRTQGRRAGRRRRRRRSDRGAAIRAREGRRHAEARGPNGRRHRGQRRHLARGRREDRRRPSVLFDAVALILSEAGATVLAREATARDFVADAFAHLKFIGCTQEATPLLQKAGVLEDRDEAVMSLRSMDDARTFVAACRKLRFWPREAKVKQA